MARGYTIRLATPEEAPILAEMRRRMFLDLGKPDDDRIRKIVQAFVPWVADAIRNGRYIAWLVEAENGDLVANAGMLLLEWPPNTRDLNPVRGYIMNVWTHPDYRRRGLARRLMETALAEARRRNIKVNALHASDEGRKLYEQLGYKKSSEMIRVGEW
jgi:ribosomal protein S18 acetylase RimI-like enzyme